MLIKGVQIKWSSEERYTSSILIYIMVMGLLLAYETECYLQFNTERKIIKHPPQSVNGISMQQQQSPIFHDSFFPVLFELDVPKWNVSDIKLELPKNLSASYTGSDDGLENLCDRSNSATSTSNGSYAPDLWDITLCPIKRKFDQLLQMFATELKVFETFNASVAKPDSHFSSCHDIRPHFSNHIIDELEIELYLVQILLQCPLGDVIHQKINVSSPNKFKYSELMQLFLNTYILPRFRVIGFPKFAIPTNTLLTLHTTHLLNYLLDSFQWTTAINTCNSQRIPRLLIIQDILKTTLLTIQERLAKKGEFVLSIPISDLSKYYKLKLADCVVTSTNKYIIRVLIPLTKDSARYKQVVIKSIPFLNKDSATSKKMICHHKNVEGTYIVEGKMDDLKPVGTIGSCLGTEICKVPNDGERGLFGKCLRAILLHDTEEMQENCKMMCLLYDPSNFPYIKRTRSDQFAIVGKSSADITVICRNKDGDTTTLVEGIPEDMGAMMVTLPCSCYMTHRSTKYEINGPCDFTMHLVPVTPKGITYDTFLEHYFHHHLQNISNAIADSLISKSQMLFDDGDGDGANSGAYAASTSFSKSPTWPIYLAYFLLLIITAFIVLGYYVLRNVYVRIGMLEISSAKAGRSSDRYPEGSQFSRNAPVAFNVRGSGRGNFSSGADAVY